MIRGPDPEFSEEDFCLEDYKPYALVIFILIIILGICILIWG